MLPAINLLARHASACRAIVLHNSFCYINKILVI
ncbi:hypothetical protein KPNJ1_01095 [Klebsiella pneumoniae 30660/NJST258_1]|uniref:Uncharacterized protein n=1 Tax=Klebsiella pneumoniae 30684/NJST258_2 TaxID=1420013 RepID=W8VEK2_KLEPN|nr:hypothetical protein KPNJ2_01126 [Klebsiella pneumoniae 30684/NJST258_2]AHM83501.1 hypothetical protein KPNJ1_01095 [Klebsiella pneumoniae 30660/NJST258_1]